MGGSMNGLHEWKATKEREGEYTDPGEGKTYRTRIHDVVCRVCLGIRTLPTNLGPETLALEGCIGASVQPVVAKENSHSSSLNPTAPDSRGDLEAPARAIVRREDPPPEEFKDPDDPHRLGLGQNDGKVRRLHVALSF